MKLYMYTFEFDDKSSIYSGYVTTNRARADRMARDDVAKFENSSGHKVVRFYLCDSKEPNGHPYAVQMDVPMDEKQLGDIVRREVEGA